MVRSTPYVLLRIQLNLQLQTVPINGALQHCDPREIGRNRRSHTVNNLNESTGCIEVIENMVNPIQLVSQVVAIQEERL